MNETMRWQKANGMLNCLFSLTDKKARYILIIFLINN